MNDTTNSFNVNRQLPGPVRTVLLGVILSIVSSLATIGCLVAIQLVVDGIEKSIPYGQVPIFADPSRDIESLLFGLFIFILNVFVLAYFAIIPISVGGGLVAFILLRLSYRHLLTTKAALLVGALVGFGVGWITASSFLPFVSIAAQWEPRAIPLQVGLVGMIAGLLQSWLLSRWLRKRML